MLLSEIEILNDISDGNTTFNVMLGNWNAELKKNRPYLIGKISDKFRLAGIDDVNGKTIAAYDLKENRYAAFLQIQHFFGGAPNVFATLVVSADKPYRGINLPTMLYATLIQEEGMILISDETQTEGGKSIWEKLAKVKGIAVYGYNTNTKKVFQVDMDDLFNEDVYDEGLNQEIADLENEEYELQDTRDERYFRIKKELEKLYNARTDTNNNVRLFAARAR
jgi:hypothetical protein